MSVRPKFSKCRVGLTKKLFARELTGNFKLRKQDASWKLFSKIPGRMCYRLKHLVPSSILDDGYVFLGFSKSGQFVLSYSLQIDANEHLLLPDYVYKLQWWLFVPCRRLQLISEVPLFGEENIYCSLFMAFCEWSGDNTKVAVYGQSFVQSGVDGCQCYLTVTAVPSLGACPDCQIKPKVATQVPSIQQCFRHSFCVHAKFELAPPFPFFAPRVQLRVDGIVILNTGDSIVALQIDTQLPLNSFDTEGRLAMEEEDSIRKQTILGSDLSILGTVSTYFTEQEEPTDPLGRLTSTDSPLPNIGEGEEENLYSVYELFSDTDQSESKSTKSSCCDRVRPSGCEKCSNNNGNSLVKSGCNCSSLQANILSNRPALRTKNCSNTSTPTTNTNNESSPVSNVASTTAALLKSSPSLFYASHECISPKSPRSPKSSGLGGDGRMSSSINGYGALPTSINAGISVLTANNVELHSTVSAEHIMSPPPPVVQVQSPRDEVCSSRSQTDVDDTASLRFNSQRSFFSPSSSACSDCPSQSSESVIVHTTHTRTVTFSVRRFSTQDQQPQEEEAELETGAEDDYDLAYKSILPVQVVWNRKPLNIIRTVRNDMSLVTVLQMTFDIEHYMAEAIRHDADWGPRYVAFCNYDLQILDVCARSQSVYGTVYALIQAKESLETTRFSRMMVKPYQTQLTFVFNLCTGLYSTLHIEPLSEVDERILKGRGDWKSPGNSECSRLRRLTAVPQSFFKSVHVLSNESVYREKSLSLLMAPALYTAILL